MMIKDPVCGMMIDPKTSAGKSDYLGQTYYFCSLGCKKEFDQNPKKFIPGPEGGPSTHA
jgi:YHS domain-containing protein